MTARGRLAAGIVGCLTLFAIGWTGLLIPSLVRSIEATFDQTDAGVGLIYLAYSVAYATGSFGGGPLTERAGRRLVLGGGVLLHGLGIVGLGLAPSWAMFIVAAMTATGMAIVGSIVYPPAMGILSVTVGLTAAMLGTVVLALASAAALIAFGRATERATVTPPA